MDIRGTKGHGLTRTEGGLIVPESAIEKPRKAWAWESWRKIKAAIKACDAEGIAMRLYCGKCGKVLTPQALDTREQGFKVECECTIREAVNGR